MKHETVLRSAISVLAGLVVLAGLGVGIGGEGIAQAQPSTKALPDNDRQISAHAQRMMNEGRQIFDGRFATLKDVLEHYNSHFKLGLNDQEKSALIEYLKSL